jgi:hypothetical protein
MWSRRSGSHRGSELEAALRELRSEAPHELVDALARSVAGRQAGPSRSWSRLAFAAALSVFILGTFASFGGLSYAASGASGTYDVVKQVVVKHKLKVSVPTSSAAAQYPPKPKPKPKAKPGPFKPPATPKAQPVGAVSPQSSTLPFTGFSLLATFVVSLALIGAGLALRRRERRS